MNHAAKSILIFGIYTFTGGLLFILFPDFFLTFLHIPSEEPVMFRIIGVLVLCYGYFYIRASFKQKKMVDFYTWTTHTRALSPLFLTLCVIPGYIHPIVITFGIADLSGAIWTHCALRAEHKKTLL
ncbi:MAG: hypothetical protein JXJ04_03880 [Spirochaetales bacterium]|nr:hypothetical protein [Spirochaetales bacterium]